MGKMILSVLFIMLAGGYADESDFNAAYIDYCTMINEGHWPNHKSWTCEA